jgi:cytochrome c biogenesis protein CcmG, thiol:disulfide interchange protein DsbE
MIASRVRGGTLVIAALLFIALAALAHHFRPIARPHPIASGEPLGQLSFTKLDGTTVALAPRAGHALLVNVFATWCPPCQSETPALADVAPRLQRAGIDVVGIDQAESSSQVERFADQYGLRYPLYIDGSNATKASLDARIIPTTVLVDRRGIVRAIHVGPLDSSEFLALTASVTR